MTLRECIALNEAQRLAQPVSAALTPVGTATVAAHRLARAIQPLDQQDRAHVLGILTDALAAPVQTKPVA